jgi:hypothetical protein
MINKQLLNNMIYESVNKPHNSGETAHVILMIKLLLF